MKRLLFWLDPRRHPKVVFVMMLAILLIDSEQALLTAWLHQIIPMALDVSEAALTGWALYSMHPKDDQDQDGPDDNPPPHDDTPDQPNGDAVERWLQLQNRVY